VRWHFPKIEMRENPYGHLLLQTVEELPTKWFKSLFNEEAGTLVYSRVRATAQRPETFELQNICHSY
jgi:hypothetical protein